MSRFERALVSDVGACVVAICNKGVAFHFFVGYRTHNLYFTVEGRARDFTINILLRVWFTRLVYAGLHMSKNFDRSCPTATACV